MSKFKPSPRVRDVGKRLYVYVVRINEFVKIGVSTDPEHRRNTIQSSSPYPVELLAVFDGGQEEEDRLQHLFKQYHERGEWFRVEGEMKKHVAWLQRRGKEWNDQLRRRIQEAVDSLDPIGPPLH